MVGEREAADLQRFLDACAPDVGCGRCTGGELYGSEDQYLGECPNCNPPRNIGDALFGPYTCKRCSSYLHSDADHGEQR